VNYYILTKVEDGGEFGPSCRRRRCRHHAREHFQYHVQKQYHESRIQRSHLRAANGKEQDPLAEAVASETSTLTKGSLHEQVATGGYGRQIIVAAERADDGHQSLLYTR